MAVIEVEYGDSDTVMMISIQILQEYQHHSDASPKFSKGIDIYQGIQMKCLIKLCV